MLLSFSLSYLHHSLQSHQLLINHFRHYCHKSSSTFRLSEFCTKFESISSHALLRRTQDFSVYNYLYPFQSSAPVQRQKPPNLDAQIDSLIELSSDDDNEHVVVNQEDCQLLVYPPTSNFQDNRITISLREYKTLSRGKYIADTIVNFYFKFLYNNLPSDLQQKVFICATEIYQKLRMPGGADDVISWKKVNLFEKEFILIPVCWNGHYSLFIIVR